MKYCLNSGNKKTKPIKEPIQMFLSENSYSPQVLSLYCLQFSSNQSSGMGAALGPSIKEHTNEKTRASKYSEKSILNSSRAFHIFYPAQINCNLI